MLKFPRKILSDIKSHLEDQKKHVTSQIADLTAQDPFSDVDRLNDNAASDTDAKEEISHERLQALLSELKQKQAATDEALKRIDKGTYGYCIECKQMIDTDRLAAIPTALKCVSCAGKKKR